jgi:hypothetical protein
LALTDIVHRMVRHAGGAGKPYFELAPAKVNLMEMR